MTEVKQEDFYIDPDDCAFFNVCLPMAPSLLQSPDEKSKYDVTYVCKQPETDDELAQIFSASQTCPLNAIKYRGKDKFLKEGLDASHHCRIVTCSPGHCPCFDKYIAERPKS